MLFITAFIQTDVSVHMIFTTSATIKCNYIVIDVINVRWAYKLMWQFI
jgi:hypothetical protein